LDFVQPEAEGTTFVNTEIPFEMEEELGPVEEDVHENDSIQDLEEILEID